MGDIVDTRQEKIWVDLVGKIIVVRTRGAVSSELLIQCHERILQLHRDSQCTALFWDALETEPLAYNEVLQQRVLTSELENLGFRTAVLVADSRMALMTRLQFSSVENFRVFYKDISGALRWLNS